MKRPSVNGWAAFFLTINTLMWVALFAWAIVDGWFPSDAVLAKYPDPSDPFYAFNKTLAVITVPIIVIAAFPVWLLIKKKRAPWVWTTVLVYICLGLMSSLLIHVLLLVFWLKESNKAYYQKL